MPHSESELLEHYYNNRIGEVTMSFAEADSSLKELLRNSFGFQGYILNVRWREFLHEAIPFIFKKVEL